MQAMFDDPIVRGQERAFRRGCHQAVAALTAKKPKLFPEDEKRTG